MEYFRQPNNRIQAGFALRAGKLLVQYDEMVSETVPYNKYDATLTIAILQSVLAHCVELIGEMSNKLPAIFNKVIPDIDHVNLINQSHIKDNTFPSILTYGSLIEHIRNALSHPTTSDNASHPSTGYSTKINGTEIISTFIFVDSPWVTRGKVQTYDEEAKAKNKIIKVNYANYGLTVHKNQKNKYEIHKDSKVYYPYLVAEIPLETLKVFTKEIANLLAQPAIDDWDGKTIKVLVA